MDYLSVINTHNRSRSPSPGLSRSPTNDRFIPNRSQLNFESSHHLLNHKDKLDYHKTPLTPARIESLKCELFIKEYVCQGSAQSNVINVSAKENADFRAQTKSLKKIEQLSIPFNYSPVLLLDAPAVTNDFYLNLLDWSMDNVLAVALLDEIFMYRQASNETSKFEIDLKTFQDYDKITSLKWMPKDNKIAIGLDNSYLSVWDVNVNKLIYSIDDHSSRVASIDWNSANMLTSGNWDGVILNHDFRAPTKKISEYKYHIGDVCSLKWNTEKRLLASGSEDQTVALWELNSTPSEPVRVLTDHTAAVKAIDWCPWKSHLIATGSGKADGTVKTWDVHTGRVTESVETCSQVSSVIWHEDKQLLLASHDEIISAWKLPGFRKAGTLKGSRGHSDRILAMVKSETDLVASLGADEVLYVWSCLQKTKKIDSAFNLTPISTKSLSKLASIR